MLPGKATGVPLTYAELLAEFRKDFQHANPELDMSEYGLHAFRRLGATLGKLKGIPDDIIQHMGGWKFEMFRAYFELTDEYLCEEALKMLS